MLSAELEFVDTLSREIREGTFSGVDGWRRLHQLRAEGVPWEDVLADPVRHLGEEARPLAPDWPATRRQ
jgi:hypothetical protein